MQVLTVYSPGNSHFYRQWAKSWSAQGWKPGIITPKEISRHGSAKAAAKARGAKLLCAANLFNVSFRPPRKTPDRIPKSAAVRLVQ